VKWSAPKMMAGFVCQHPSESGNGHAPMAGEPSI